MTTRRAFLSEFGMGFTGLALGAILHRDGIVRAGEAGAHGWSRPDGRPHFAPRAKNVIWLFMIGGTSHVETFDPKPALNRYAGKTIAETPYAASLKSKLTDNVRTVFPDDANGHIRHVLYPLQVGDRKRGQSGTEGRDRLAQPGA